MSISKREVVVCHCERCFHTWIPRTALTDPEAIPIRCGNPKCNTPYWFKPRKTGSTDDITVVA